MKFARGDFRKLQVSLCVGLALIAIGGVSVYFGNDSMRTAGRELAEAQAARNEADGKLRRIRGEEMEIREKAALFRQLETRGIVGEERRLEWSELLEALRDRRQLAGMRYEFGPRRPLDGAPAEEFSYFVSPMILQLDLLHEEDLTRLLADIRQQARALIRVRSCALSRAAETPGNAAESAAVFHLRAECRIDWVTLRRAHADEGRQGS